MGNSAYWGYDPNLEFKLYGKRIANVHIKDCSKELYSVKFGQGSVDFENISKLLEKNKYKKDFIIQGYRGKNNYAIAKEQLNFSKKFF